MVMQKWKSVQEHIEDQINNRGYTKEQKKVIQQFVDQLRANEVKDKGICGYLYFIEKLAKFKKKSFHDWSKEDVISYLAKWKGRYYRKMIRRFFRFLNDGELPKIVSWIDIKEKKTERKIKRTLSDADKKKILKVLDNQRDRTIFMLMIDSGLRPCEICSLKIDSVKFDEYGAVLFVPKGKTGQREVRLFDSLPDIKLWINNHPKKDEKTASLFYNISTNRYGQPLRWEAIRNMFRKLNQTKIFDYHINPYITRRTKLTEWGQQLTPHELMVLAGHSSIRTSDYYVRIKGEDVNNKLLQQQGLIKKEEEQRIRESAMKPITCANCKMENPIGAKFCYNCSAVLDIKTAIDMGKYIATGKKVFTRMQEKGIISFDKKIIKELLREMIKRGEIKI